jgi:hypothetical protein
MDGGEITSVISVGISLITFFTVLGGGFTAYGKVTANIKNIKESVDKLAPKVDGIVKTETDLGNVKESVNKLTSKVDDLVKKVYSMWKDEYSEAHSPRVLNDRGANILEKSGIKEIIDKNKDCLLEEVRKANPTNAYDAEVVTLRVVDELPRHCADIDMDALKNGAFSVGSDINGVLFVGGIYLRNQIFSSLGFELGDIDKNKNEKGEGVSRK